MANVFKRLGIPPTSSPEEVKVAWRKLASRYHPDRGGNPAVFRRLHLAYDEAMKIVSKPKKCTRCEGSGKTIETYGFTSVKIMCYACGGRGSVSSNG